MKTKILIVEDSFAKFFCMKQLLESQLKVPVHSQDTQGAAELMKTIVEVRPTLMFVRPAGGVSTLLTMLKKRQTNRRNTEITLVLSSDLEECWWNEIKDHATLPASAQEPRIARQVTKAA